MAMVSLSSHFSGVSSRGMKWVPARDSSSSASLLGLVEVRPGKPLSAELRFQLAGKKAQFIANELVRTCVHNWVSSGVSSGLSAPIIK